MNAPRSRVGSITVKWKKFGTFRTLLRAAHLAKLSNQARRSLLTTSPKATPTELQKFFTEMGVPSRKTTVSEMLHQSGRTENHSGVWQALKGIRAHEETILRWSDETKIELCGPNSKRRVWSETKYCSSAGLYHRYGKARCWQYRSTGTLLTGRDGEMSQLRE